MSVTPVSEAIATCFVAEFIPYISRIISNDPTGTGINCIRLSIESLHGSTMCSTMCEDMCECHMDSTVRTLFDIIDKTPEGSTACFPSLSETMEMKKKIEAYLLLVLCPLCQDSTVRNREERERRYQETMRLRKASSA